LSDRPGNFYPPTILTGIPPGTPADTEEFLGPVALLFRVPDIDAAIRLAKPTLVKLALKPLPERDHLLTFLNIGGFICAYLQTQLVLTTPEVLCGKIKISSIASG